MLQRHDIIPCYKVEFCIGCTIKCDPIPPWLTPDHQNHGFVEVGQFIRHKNCNDRGILHSWSFHMEFMKGAFGEFHKFHIKWPRVFDSIYHVTLKMDFTAFKINIISIKNTLLTCALSMILLHVLWHDVAHWIAATSWYDKNLLMTSLTWRCRELWVRIQFGIKIATNRWMDVVSSLTVFQSY